MMTTEGWTDIMADGIDAVGIEKEPQYNHKPYAALYFVIFMILGCFLLINLFTAVITDHINKVKESKELGTMLLSNDAQKQFVMVQNVAVKTRPIKRSRPPENKFRSWFYHVVQSNEFDLLIIIIITLNTIVVAMTYDRMTNSYEQFIEIANNLFVILYNVELVMKFIGLGFSYFQDSWNKFDFICVVGSDISILLSFFSSGTTVHSIVIFLRAFRLIRLIRFINSFFGVTTLSTILNSAPQIQNILSLLAVIIFMYAVLGLNLFSPVMYRQYYNDQNNFRNIFNALVLLLRCMTGENWNAIMHELASSDMYDREYWVKDQTYDEMERDGIKGWGTWMAFPYFISFFIINAIVILDLSIGVFINALSDARKDSKSPFSRERMAEFVELWGDYDPNAKGWITADQLVFLIFELSTPWGFGKVIPSYQNEWDFDDIYRKRVQENILIAKSFREDKHGDDNEINKLQINNEIYLFNFKKGLVIRQIRTIQILKLLNIPLYENNRVHFSDVLRQVIKNGYDSIRKNYEPSGFIKGKIDRKWGQSWKKQLKRRKIIIEAIETYMAGKLIFDNYVMKQENKNNKFYGDVDIEEAFQYKDGRNKTLNKSIVAHKNPFDARITPLPEGISDEGMRDRYYRESSECESRSEEEIKHATLRKMNNSSPIKMRRVLEGVPISKSSSTFIDLDNNQYPEASRELYILKSEPWDSPLNRIEMEQRHDEIKSFK